MIKFLSGVAAWMALVLAISLGTVFAISLTDILPVKFLWPFTAGIVTPFIAYGLWYGVFAALDIFKRLQPFTKKETRNAP